MCSLFFMQFLGDRYCLVDEGISLEGLSNFEDYGVRGNERGKIKMKVYEQFQNEWFCVCWEG